MVKAFESDKEPLANARWVGEVYEVGPDDFTSVLHEDYIDRSVEVTTVVPLANIVETERPRVRRGMLFYCDVVVLEDESVRLRSIEFDDDLTHSLHGQTLGILFNVMDAAERREF